MTETNIPAELRSLRQWVCTCWKEEKQVCTYLAMLALGFALGAAFTAAGLLAERKGARQ